MPKQYSPKVIAALWAKFPGLQGAAEPELRAAIQACNRAVYASSGMTEVYIYCVLGFIACYASFAFYSKTSHLSFLVLTALCAVLALARIRGVWRRELVTELHKRYGSVAIPEESKSAA